MKSIASLLPSRFSRGSSVLPSQWLKRSINTLAVCTGLLTGAAHATQNATLTTHHSFDGTVSTDAAGPVKGLVLASDGNYYGCARSGFAGAGGGDPIPNSYRGSIFKVTPSGEYSILCNFDGTTHGATPFGTLSEGADHQLYGVTINNSVSNSGTVFKVNFEGTITTLYTFLQANSTAIGVTPDGVLIGSDGKLYVTCRAGGSTSVGSIVKMNADGTSPSRLATFNGSNGSGPVGRLVEDSDGNFWGATENGGSASAGAVFKMTAAGVITSVSLDGTHHKYPKSGLIKGTDGNLYGTTYNGGLGNRGVVYKMTTGGTLTVLAQMAVATGTNPGGTLVEGPDHNFYGLAYGGGSAGYGTIYRMTAGGTLSALLSFQNTSAPRGAASVGDLILGADNHLWGTTTLGGVYISGGTAGTVFSADIGLTSPDLAVEAPVGTALASGASVSYGSVGNHLSQTKTFTLKNNGYAALTLTGASVTGGNAADFAVDTSAMDSSVLPGEETTFTVTLTPTATGTRATTLQILSNDASHGTYTISLTGTAIASSVFSFALPTYTYVQGATSATLNVTRAISNVAQTVQINTQDGTENAFPPYSAALSGLDYNSLAGAATTLSFAIGQTSKNVVVSFPARTGILPNRRFNAILSNPSSGATLGNITNATIQINATDSVKPGLVVISPTAAAVLDAETSPSVEVTGIASDLHGISKVVVTANGSVANATLGEVSGTSVAFSRSFAPLLGANTVTVSSYDLRNNVTSVTRTFTVTGGVTFTLTRSVPAAMTLKPDSVGTVALVGTPVRSANSFLPVKANSNPKTCLVVPGAPVKVTATALNGYTFSHWTGLPETAVVLGNVATFAMPAQDFGATAHFVVAPFAGATGTSASFYGLIQPSDGSAPNVNTVGYISGSLAVATGVFTGNVYMDGVAQAFSATFFGDGSSTFKVGTVLQSALTIGDRQLTLAYNASTTHDAILVQTTKNGKASIGLAKRGYYSATRKVPSGLLNATTSGYFTFAITSPAEQNESLDKSLYPQGDGFGTITLTNNGTMSVAGTLADGTAFTCTTAFVDASIAPVFVQLTTPGASTKLGVFSGILSFDATAPNTDVNGSMFWIRPASSVALYSDGWPDGISAIMGGARYTKTATAQAALALGAVNATTGNAALALSDGKLISNISKTLFNISGNSVSYTQGASTAGFTLSIGLAGNFSGTFTPNWGTPSSTKPAFKGIMISKGLNKIGFGYFLSNKVSDADPESGSVILTAQPH